MMSLADSSEDKARVEEERRLWDQLNQRLTDSVRKGTLARNAAQKMGRELTTDPELMSLFARVFEFAESGGGYIHERLQEPNPVEPLIGKHHEGEPFGFMAKILLGLESPELRRQMVETLEKGAEVLRRHYGWSAQELAQQVRLPPDWNAEYSDLKPSHLGRRVAELREIASLTSGDLAFKVSIPPEELRLLEEGQQDAIPDVAGLQSLASALGTNPTFLWYWAQQLASEEA